MTSRERSQLSISERISDETFRGSRLEAGDEDRLRVRRPDQSPPFAEQHARAVDADHFVVAREVLHGCVDDRELPIISAVDSDFGVETKRGTSASRSSMDRPDSDTIRINRAARTGRRRDRRTTR